jgi:hypothetical protein
MSTQVDRELQRNERAWGVEWLQILDHENCICSDCWDGYAVKLINPAMDIHNQDVIDDLLERTYGMAGRGFVTFIGVQNPLPELKDFLDRNFSSLKKTRIFDTTYLKQRFPEITESEMVQYNVADTHNRTRSQIETGARGDDFYIHDPWMLRDDNLFPLTISNVAWFYIQEKSKDNEKRFGPSGHRLETDAASQSFSEYMFSWEQELALSLEQV